MSAATLPSAVPGADAPALPFDTSRGGPVLTVDLGALTANYRALCARVAPSVCAPVVKADAYGLGLAPVARALAAAGARTFFVAQLAEGLTLRRLLPDAEVLVLDGVAAGRVAEFAAARLVPVLNSLVQVRRWAGEAPGAPAALHLDTGMARLGLSAGEAAALAADPFLVSRLALRLVMTHLACADEPEHALNRAQLERFADRRAGLPDAPTSIGNSAGILLGPAWHGDLVRPGLALYGASPVPGLDAELRPVVALHARVLQVRALEDRDTVGYGATWHSAGPGRAAVLGLGYADGYPRSLGNRGFGVLRGRRLPVIGRVSMDSTVVDARAADAGLAEGSWVRMLGGDVDLDVVAALAGRSVYELLTGLGSRVERVYLDGP